jgi:hypothetical protein
MLLINLAVNKRWYWLANSFGSTLTVSVFSHSPRLGIFGGGAATEYRRGGSGGGAGES